MKRVPTFKPVMYHVNGLMQKRCNSSSELAIESFLPFASNHRVSLLAYKYMYFSSVGLLWFDIFLIPNFQFVDQHVKTCWHYYYLKMAHHWVCWWSPDQHFDFFLFNHNKSLFVSLHLKTITVETLYSTIYYSKYFIELNIDKSTQYVALWTHKRHPIPRPFGRAMECLLWVFQQKLIVL